MTNCNYCNKEIKKSFINVKTKDNIYCNSRCMVYHCEREGLIKNNCSYCNRYLNGIALVSNNDIFCNNNCYIDSKN